MSFKLTSQFTMGNYQFFGGVQDVEIRRSVKEMVDTAVITLPALGIANNNQGLPPSSVNTSKLFNPGDPVTIMLGYNYNNVQEFKGFVKRVNASIPVKVECEGFAWQLRNKTFSGSWDSITLQQLLTNLVQGTAIKLSAYLPAFTLTHLKIQPVNGLKVLEHLRDKCFMSVYFLFDTLYVGLEEGQPGATGTQGSTSAAPVYQLGWNTLRNEKLKWRDLNDTPVQVQFMAAKGKNKQRPFYTYGPAGGSVVNENIANVTDPATIQALTKDAYNKSCYTGYEGSFTGFLQPFVQLCDTSTLLDPMYEVRQGRYFTQGTTVKFGVNGATREVFIGAAV